MSRLSLREGAAAIEFALITPIIILILMGIIEYGWLLYRRSEATRAVREGVRFAVVMPQNSVPDVPTLAETRCVEVLTLLHFDLTDATIIAETSDLTGDAGGIDDTLTLTLTMPYRPITGGLVPTPAGLQVAMSMMMQDSQ